MPRWVADDKIWKKAKAAVDRKKYNNDNMYYAVVATVYKKMGGKIKHEKSILAKES